VALVLDGGALYAQADRSDPGHRAVVEVLTAERGPLATTELAVAEADYLILHRLGVDVEFAFLEDLASGTFVVECLTRGELRTALERARRHRDLALGLVDVSLVLLARRLRTRRLVTFDERALRTLTPLQGGSFVLLPADV